MCDLNGSIAIGCRRDSQRAALPVGKWNVDFTNGVTEVCDVFNFDGGHATVDEPRRRSRGKVVVKGGSIVMTSAPRSPRS